MRKLTEREDRNKKKKPLGYGQGREEKHAATVGLIHRWRQKKKERKERKKEKRKHMCRATLIVRRKRGKRKEEMG